MQAVPLRAARLLGALLILAGAGCGDVDQNLARWSYISPAIFQPNCATTSCHSPAAAAAGLDFSTPDNGYRSLTDLWVWVVVAPDGGTPPAGVPCSTVEGALVCEQQLRPLVTPYDPDGSRLVNVLLARDAPRMPPDRSLTDAQNRLVERWILDGACQTGLSCQPDAGSAGDGGTVVPSSADGAADAKAGG